MHIRIIAPPNGEAPEEIRRAWVGLVIPLAQASPEPVVMRNFGVVSGPRNMIIAIVLGLLGFGKPNRGYVVNARAAFELLAQHNPSAADWWRTNTPHLFKRGQPLMFDDFACEVVRDDDQM